MVSIIIPIATRVDLARRCIETVRAQTLVSHEVIVVANGITKDEALRLDRDQVLMFDEPLGYPRAINEGVKAAKGDYLCLLNDDTEIMATGWLTRLTDTLNRVPDSQIVSPVTDFIFNGPQHVATCAETVMLVDRLVFVCVLMRRAWWDKIGTLDERFGLGGWEDNDYSLRTAMAGGKMYVDPGVFIYHVGHATNKTIMSEDEFRALLIENGRKFEEKWSQSTL